MDALSAADAIGEVGIKNLEERAAIAVAKLQALNKPKLLSLAPPMPWRLQPRGYTGQRPATSEHYQLRTTISVVVTRYRSYNHIPER